MNQPVQMRPKAKYRFAVSSSHKSTHNQSQPHKHSHGKHTYWTSPGGYGHALNGGKVPAALTPKTMVMTNGRIRMRSSA